MKETTFTLLFSLLLSPISITIASESNKIVFINELPSAVELFWEEESTAGEGGNQQRHSQGTIHGRGGTLNINTFPGHIFTYDDALGHRQSIQINQNENAIPLTGNQDFVRVRCETTVNGGSDGDELDILVRPHWSPWGAARFLELVREGYYNGCALNRVVPKFLTQFGIGADYNARTKRRTDVIPDDNPQNIPFREGYMSYAGSGPNSRSTEVFIVMPGTPQGQLDYFGVNAWETPFGEVDLSRYGGDATLAPMARWHAYGDMPPWGEGPDPQKIYLKDGYEKYLVEGFPELDYLGSCYVVEEKLLNDAEVEEL